MQDHRYEKHLDDVINMGNQEFSVESKQQDQNVPPPSIKSVESSEPQVGNLSIVMHKF